MAEPGCERVKIGFESGSDRILKQIQKLETKGTISIISFEKTKLKLSGLSTKTISEPKIQETSTFQIIKCMKNENLYLQNCSRHKGERKDAKIEINKRFGLPIFIPLIDFEQESINLGTLIFTDVESKLSKPDIFSNIIASLIFAFSLISLRTPKYLFNLLLSSLKEPVSESFNWYERLKLTLPLTTESLI